MNRWNTAREYYENNPEGAQGVSDIELARHYYKGLVERGELNPEKENEAEFVANFTRESLVPEDPNFGGVYSLADIRKRFPDSSKYKDDLLIRQITSRIKHRDPIDVERQLRGHERIPAGHLGALMRGAPATFEQMLALGLTGVAGRVVDNKLRDIDFMTNPENSQRKRLEAMPKGSPGRKYLDRMLEKEATVGLEDDIQEKRDSIPAWQATKDYGIEWQNEKAPKRWKFSQEDMATLGGKGGQVLGSMSAFVFAGVLSNAIGGPAATAGLVGAFGAAVHSGDMVQFADEAGATPEERERLYFHANTLGALEMLPIGHFVRGTTQFGRAAMRAVVPGASKQAIDQAIAASTRVGKTVAKKTGLRHLDSIVKGAALEGSQEFVSEVYSNFAKSGIDPEIAVLDGGLEAALGGAFGGAVFGVPGAVGSVIQGRQEARFEKEADKFIRDIRASLDKHQEERQTHNQQNVRPPEWKEQGVQGMVDDLNDPDPNRRIVPTSEQFTQTGKVNNQLATGYLSDENGDAKKEVLVTRVERNEAGEITGVFYSEDGGRTENPLGQDQFILKMPDETKEYEPKKNEIDNEIFESSKTFEDFENALLGYGKAFTRLEIGEEVGYAYDNMRKADIEMVKKAIEKVTKMLQDDTILEQIAYYRGWNIEKVQEYAVTWPIEANEAFKKLTEVQEEQGDPEQVELDDAQDQNPAPDTAEQETAELDEEGQIDKAADDFRKAHGNLQKSMLKMMESLRGGEWTKEDDAAHEQLKKEMDKASKKYHGLVDRSTKRKKEKKRSKGIAALEEISAKVDEGDLDAVKELAEKHKADKTLDGLAYKSGEVMEDIRYVVDNFEGDEAVKHITSHIQNALQSIMQGSSTEENYHNTREKLLKTKNELKHKDFEAVGDINKAEAEYEKNPTPENKKAVEDANKRRDEIHKQFVEAGDAFDEFNIEWDEMDDKKLADIAKNDPDETKREYAQEEIEARKEIAEREKEGPKLKKGLTREQLEQGLIKKREELADLKKNASQSKDPDRTMEEAEWLEKGIKAIEERLLEMQGDTEQQQAELEREVKVATKDTVDATFADGNVVKAAARGAEAHRKALTAALKKAIKAAIKNNKDTPLGNRLKALLNKGQLSETEFDDRFFDHAFAESLRIYNDVQAEQQKQEIRERARPALEETMAENDINGSQEVHAFSLGWWHSINGKNRSNLPTAKVPDDLHETLKKGYDLAEKFKAKNPDAFKTRGKKDQGVGPVLKRLRDIRFGEKDNAEGIVGEIGNFIDEMLKISRADVFNSAPAADATPGVARALEFIRSKILSPRKYITLRSDLKIREPWGGRGKPTFKSMLAYYIVTGQNPAHAMAWELKDWAKYERNLANVMMLVPIDNKAAELHEEVTTKRKQLEDARQTFKNQSGRYTDEQIAEARKILTAAFEQDTEKGQTAEDYTWNDFERHVVRLETKLQAMLDASGEQLPDTPSIKNLLDLKEKKQERIDNLKESIEINKKEYPDTSEDAVYQQEIEINGLNGDIKDLDIEIETERQKLKGVREETNPEVLERMEAIREAFAEYVEKWGEYGRRFNNKSNIASIIEVLEKIEEEQAEKTERDDDDHPFEDGRWQATKIKNWLKTLMQSEEEETTARTRAKAARRPKLDHIERKGMKDHRGGRDITFEELTKTFNFGGARSGGYVTSKQEQDHINYAYDAFMDLAETMGVDPSKIGFGGRLHIAFGALGAGRHSAHYQNVHPVIDGDGRTVGVVQAINLTNTKGDGALAHEYTHAIDFMFRNASGEKPSNRNEMAIATPVQQLLFVLKHRIPTLEEAESTVKSYLDGSRWWTDIGRTRPIDTARRYVEWLIDDMEFFKEHGKPRHYRGGAFYRSWYLHYSMDMGNEYWSRDTELIARAGEAAIYDFMHANEAENNYLVSPWVEEDFVSKKNGFKSKIYPAGPERVRINKAFRIFFDHMDFNEEGYPVIKDGYADALSDMLFSELKEFAEKYDKELPESDAAKTEEDMEKLEKLEEEAAKRREADIDKLIEESKQSEESEPTETNDLDSNTITADKADELVDNVFDEMEAAEQEEPPVAVSAKETPERKLVNSLVAELRWLTKGKLSRHLPDETKTDIELKWERLFELADIAYGGTQADGVYSPRQAYDAMEVAAGIVVKEHIADMDFDTAGDLEHVLRDTWTILRMLPTQSKRDKKQLQFQQFSTPMPISIFMAWVAKINSKDIVLEPSAGTGILANMASVFGPQAFILNEYERSRFDLLHEALVPNARIYNEDAKHLNSVLPENDIPTVVVMNPPFSSDFRKQGKNDTRVGMEHVEQALKRVAYGGRVVVLLGEGMGQNIGKVNAWWDKIGKSYRVRANIGLSGELYRTMGTSYPNQIIVIDKMPPNNSKVVSGDYKDAKGEDAIDNLVQAAKDMEKVKNERANPGKRFTNKSFGEETAELGSVSWGEQDDLSGETDAGDGGRVSDEQPEQPDGGMGDRGDTGETDGTDATGVSRRDTADEGSGAGKGKKTDRKSGGRKSGKQVQPVDKNKRIADAKAAAKKDGVDLDDGLLNEMDELNQELADDEEKMYSIAPKTPTPEQRKKLRNVFEKVWKEYSPGKTVEEAMRKMAVFVYNKFKNFKNELKLWFREVLLPRLQKENNDQLPQTESISVGERKQDTNEENTDSPWRPYTPLVEGMPHPGALVESAALGGVDAPKPTYTKLKSKILEAARKDGRLSAAQMEAVLRALSAFEEMLPNGERKGFMIGDGTGVGKAREIIGVILEMMAQGHKKHVVISAKEEGLFRQFQKDYASVTGVSAKQAEQTVQSQKKWKSPADKIKDFDEGILYTTYATFAHKYDTGTSGAQTKKTRVEQLKEWLGPDFDGTIVFDETHNMGNAVNLGNSRGGEASLRARAGLDIQEAFPNARILYLSATAARDVEKLSFATRLGLWGNGTKFTDIEDFVTRIAGHSSPIGAMELISQNMKALGVYMARHLSYDGVTYRPLTHELSPEQEEQFNLVADAWMKVFRHIEDAVTATGVSGREKAQIMSQFWNQQIDFFQVYTMSLAAPTLIKDMEKRLEEGGSVVIQLTRTMEAALDRELARLQAEGIDPKKDATQVDTSPMPLLMDYIEKSFPIYEHMDVTDANGNVRSVRVQRKKKNKNGEQLYVDDDGVEFIADFDTHSIVWDQDNDVEIVSDIETGIEVGRTAMEDVVNPDALKMRNELIKSLALERIAPDSLIDQVIKYFGKDRIAEATGRSKRIGLNEKGVPVEVPIPKRTAEKETKEFQDGKRDILIFSSGSATGLDFHAGLDVKNQKKRYHYAADMGWNVTTFVQGLGRTHRSNQKQPPEYVLVQTNLKAQKRFTSIVARRLNQLGALTSGQRDAGNKGIISAEDNIMTPEAHRALLRVISIGRVFNVNNLWDEMGIRAVNEQGVYDPSKVDLKQWLNRLYGVHVKRQNEIFDAFIEQLDIEIERMKESGTYDHGMITLTTGNYLIESLDIVHRQEVFKADEAKADYLNVRAHKTTETLSLAKFFERFVTEDNKSQIFFAKNKATGRIWAFTPHRGIDSILTGQVTPAMRKFGPTNPYGFPEPKENLWVDHTHGSDSAMTVNWERIDDINEVKKLWEKEYGGAKKTMPVDYHILVGTVLPVWDLLPSSWDLVRVRPDNGKSVVGLQIPDHALRETLDKFGVQRQTNYKASDVQPLVMQDHVVVLDNDWTIQRKRVSNDYRMELMVPVDEATKGVVKQLEDMGLFVEIISHKARIFIPNNNLEAVEALVKKHKIVDIVRGVNHFLDQVGGSSEESMSRMESSNPEAIQASVREIADLFRRMAPARTRLKYGEHEQELTAGGVSAAVTYTEAARTVIEMIDGDAPFKTLHHEVIHALRNLFTMQEWSALINHAHDNKWLERYDIAGRYPAFYNNGKPSEAAYEEAIAEGFAEWAYDIWVRRRRGKMKIREAKKKWGKLFPVYMRMVRFLDKVARILRNHGRYHAKGVSEILERVASGEVGSRILAYNPSVAQIENASVRVNTGQFDAFSAGVFNSVGGGKMVFSTEPQDMGGNKNPSIMSIRPKNPVIVRVPGPTLLFQGNVTEPNAERAMQAAAAYHMSNGADAVIFVAITPSGINTSRSIVVADPSVVSNAQSTTWEDFTESKRNGSEKTIDETMFDTTGRIMDAYHTGHDVKPARSMAISKRSNAREFLDRQYNVSDKDTNKHIYPIKTSGYNFPLIRSLMDKARLQGFHFYKNGEPLILWHGSSYKIKAFNHEEWGGETTQAQSAKEGTWLVNLKPVAGGYAKLSLQERAERDKGLAHLDMFKTDDLVHSVPDWLGFLVGAGFSRFVTSNHEEHIMPLMIRGRLKKFDMKGERWNEDTKLTEKIKQAKKEGYDGAVFQNFIDNATPGTDDAIADHYIIFDPKNIRSVDAAFDLDKSESDELMAMIQPVNDPKGILRELDERKERQEKGKGAFAHIKAGLESVQETMQAYFTRQVVGALPNLKEFHRMRLWLGKLKEELNNLPEDTMKLMAGWFEGISPDSFALASHIVILEDALWDFKNERAHFLNENIEEGEKEITQDDIESLLAELHAKMKNDPAAQKAYALRTIYMNNLRRELVDEGVLTPMQVQNEHWFRHFIVRYNTEHNPASTGKNLRRAFFHGREGTYEEYMLDIMKVDYLAITKARSEIAKAKMRRQIRNSAYNVHDLAIEMAEEHRKQAIMDVMADEA